MKKIRIASLLALSLVSVAVIIIGLMVISIPIYRSFEIEAGEKVNISDYLKKDMNDASFVTDMENFDAGALGTHTVIIKVKSKEYTVSLVIVDTIAPTGEPNNRKSAPGQTLEASELVKNIKDGSTVECSFKSAPDFNKSGSQEITIILTDAAKNKSEVKVTLEIEKDTEPPVFEEAPDKYFMVGDSVAYKTGVKVTDNSGGEVTLDVDSSKVDMDSEGIYTAKYTATDPSGNKSTKEVKIIVKNVLPEEVERLADAVLSEIINDGMDKKAKAKAIFNWIQRSVSYVNTGDKTTVVLSSYDALKKGKGDCYTFFAIGEFLLTRAGIDNKPLTRVGGTARHYWSIVNVGEGWYHFDSCPTFDHHNGFMMTESEVQAYTKKRGNQNYYVYDKTGLPEIVK